MDALGLRHVEIEEKEPPVLVLGLQLLQTGRPGGVPGRGNDGVVLVFKLWYLRKPNCLVSKLRAKLTK